MSMPASSTDSVASAAALPGNISISTSMLISVPQAERAFPLNSEQFQTLCDGDQGRKDEGWLNICIGSFLTCVVGIVGLWNSVNVFDEVKKDHYIPIISVFILALITVCTLLGGFYLYNRRSDLNKNSSYSRLVVRIRNYFLSSNT